MLSNSVIWGLKSRWKCSLGVPLASQQDCVCPKGPTRLPNIEEFDGGAVQDILRLRKVSASRSWKIMTLDKMVVRSKLTTRGIRGEL